MEIGLRDIYWSSSGIFQELVGMKFHSCELVLIIPLQNVFFIFFLLIYSLMRNHLILIMLKLTVCWICLQELIKAVER